MTVNIPKPANTSAVEPKVKWATIGTYLIGAFGLFLVQVFTDSDNALLIAVLPDPIEMFVLPLVPALSSLAFGYSAAHQWRVNPSNNQASPSVG